MVESPSAMSAFVKILIVYVLGDAPIKCLIRSYLGSTSIMPSGSIFIGPDGLNDEKIKTYNCLKRLYGKGVKI